MANIQKRIGKTGKTTYRVQVRVKGKTPRTKSFNRLTDAKAWARDVESDLGRGRHVPTTEERRRTFAQLVKKYLAEVLPKKIHNKDQRNFETRLNWWKEQLGDRYLADISPADIAACRDQLEKTLNRYGKPLSGATINRYLAAVGAAFKHAVKEWHWLEVSPVSNVARRKNRRAAPDFFLTMNANAC